MSEFDRRCIEGYLEDFESGDAIATIWTVNDVIDAASSWGKEVTEREARTVLRRVHDRHDAEYGISWTEIEHTIDEVCGER